MANVVRGILQISLWGGRTTSQNKSGAPSNGTSSTAFPAAPSLPIVFARPQEKKGLVKSIQRVSPSLENGGLISLHRVSNALALVQALAKRKAKAKWDTEQSTPSTGPTVPAKERNPTETPRCVRRNITHPIAPQEEIEVVSSWLKGVLPPIHQEQHGVLLRSSQHLPKGKSWSLRRESQKRNGPCPQPSKEGNPSTYVCRAR